MPLNTGVETVMYRSRLRVVDVSMLSIRNGLRKGDRTALDGYRAIAFLLCFNYTHNHKYTQDIDIISLMRIMWVMIISRDGREKYVE